MEELFDKDISIVNKYFDKAEKKTKYKVSHLKGFWSSDNGISINGTQLTKSDGLSARILIHDSRNEAYQNPEEFEKEQKTWTLKPDDYIIKDIINDFTTITELLENYQEVIKITKVSIKDYGSEGLQHFVVTGE